MDVNVAAFIESEHTVNPLVVNKGHINIKATFEKLRHRDVFMSPPKRRSIAI